MLAGRSDLKGQTELRHKRGIMRGYGDVTVLDPTSSTFPIVLVAAGGILFALWLSRLHHRSH
jgi:hypothetical protein